MEIKPPGNDIYTQMARSISAAAENNLNNAPPAQWKLNQLIQAVITKIADNQLFLDIQGVKASTPKPANLDLQAGDILKLQIEQLRPMPQFKIVALQKVAENSLLTQALKTLQSQTTSSTPLLKDISHVANRPSLRPSPLAADVNAVVREIYKQLPSPFNLKTASQLKNHLQFSGTFTQANIKNQLFASMQTINPQKLPRVTPQVNANIKATLDQDLGAQLHRLANLIRTQLVELPTSASPVTNTVKTPSQPGTPVPESKVGIQQQATPRPQVEQTSIQNLTQREEAMQTFLRQVESSLTHMQQTQLQSLNDSQAGRPTWLMELPIKDGQDIDVFELRINEEENAKEEKEIKKAWNVILKFDLSGLGKVKAHVKMQDDFISAHFISEKAETMTLFNDHFDFLKNRLSYNGLNVGNIDAVQANLSNFVPNTTTTKLDERT